MGLATAEAASRPTIVLAVIASVGDATAEAASSATVVFAVIAIVAEATAEVASSGTTCSTIRKPTVTASTRLDVVLDGVTVPVPVDPAAVWIFSET